MMSITVGKYIYTTKPIGRGSFSKVYKGYDTETDTVYAIKVIEKNTLTENLIDRLHDEILLMSEIRHPGIANVVEFLETTARFYIILEYCAGGDLAGLIRNGRIPEPQAKIYTNQLSSALLYLKNLGVVHRDLKPQNILLTKNYTDVKLTDFNFAKRLDPHELSQTLCGTPLYMAPELLGMQNYTNKADLWSVGIIIYEMVYGQTPYNSACNIMDLKRLIETQPIDYCEIYVSKGCIELLKNLLMIDPHERITWPEFFTNPWLEFKEIVAFEEADIVKAVHHRVIDNYIPRGDQLRDKRYSMSEPIPITKPIGQTARLEVCVKPVDSDRYASSAPEKAPTIWSLFSRLKLN